MYADEKSTLASVSKWNSVKVNTLKYPKKCKFYWKLFGNLSFLLNMQNEQTLKIPEFHFCIKLSRRPLKNTRIKNFIPWKIRRAYLSLCHGSVPPPPPPPCAKINYSYAKALLFVWLKGCSPQVKVNSRKTIENGISHLRENGLHSSDEGNPYIKTNLHTGCLWKIAEKRGTQIASWAHIYMAFSVVWTGNQQCSVSHFLRNLGTLCIYHW